VNIFGREAGFEPGLGEEMEVGMLTRIALVSLFAVGIVAGCAAKKEAPPPDDSAARAEAAARRAETAAEKSEVIFQKSLQK
jgi:hypothetical protein